MGMRIWYQSMTQLATLTNYRKALEEHAKKYCSDGTQIVFNGVSEDNYHGRMPAEVLQYSYAKLILQTEVIDICRAAEKNKFDAVILGSFSEPFLPEIRSLLSIPVISMPECTLLVACSMAEKFALTTLAPANVKRVKALVKRHGLESRVSGYYSLAHPVDEDILNVALKKPKQVVTDFLATAEQAKADGADLIVPAEGVLNLIIQRSNTNPIGRLSVLDCVSTSFLYAEMMINMQRRLGIGIGRMGSYAMPPADLLAELDAVTQAKASAKVKTKK